MTKKIQIQIRQGDVFLEECSIPQGAVEVAVDPKRGHVLAEGEVTGHAHRVPSRYARNATTYRTEHDARYMRVTAPVPLRHEEHKTVCALCPEPGVGDPLPIATRRVVNDFTATGYRCNVHGSDDETVALAEPGATEIPTGRYERIIHAEYVPGAVPRQVED